MDQKKKIQEIDNQKEIININLVNSMIQDPKHWVLHFP